MFATPLVVAAGVKDDDDERSKNAKTRKASLVRRRSIGGKDDDDDGDDALPFFLNHREEKTSPEEHESAAILFELMSSSHPRGGRGGAFFRGATKNAVAALGKAGVKSNINSNVNTTSVDNNDSDKNGQRKRKKSANAETPATTMKTKRRLSAKFNTAAVGEEKMAATRADGEGLDFTTCAAETEKKGKKGKKYCAAAKKEETTVSMKHHQQQQSSAFISLSDFIMKRFKADASVPKSWVAFARAMARGEDEAVREASMCLDDTEEEFKIRRKSTATTTSSKKTKNNEDDDDEEDDDDDDENEAGAEDQDGVFIDAACRRARYLKGVTKLSADLIRHNPSAAWLECIAADAHDRARQIRRTKKKCEKNRKQSITSMYRACGLNGNNNNNNQKEMVEDVSTIALANVYANWELGLAKEMELYCNQLENVELISVKAKADGRASSAEENIFSMEQLERSNNCEHEKAKQFVTELRTHSEKVAALWRYNAKGRNAF